MRKYTQKKRYGRRKNYRKRRGNLAVKAYKMAKSVFRSEEKKYYNNQITITNPADNTWNNYNLLNIGQGDSATTRDGNQITLKSLFFRVRITPTGDYGLGLNYRVVIVQDTQVNPNGTVPGPANLFLDASDFHSNYNWPAVLGRYKILYDKIHNCNPIGYSGGYSTTLLTTWNDKNLNTDKYFFINLKRFYKNIRWYNDIGSSISRNGIYMYVCVDNTRNSTTTFNYVAKFTDS